MKNLVIRSSFFWLILTAFLLFIVLLPYYLNGYIILGGEGDNFVDFSAYLNNYRDTWENVGTGFFAISLNKVFANIFVLVLLEKLLSNVQVINFLVVFLIYYLPFLGMFAVSKRLKLSSPLSFLIALFYVINPFTIYLLTSLNHWNLASFFVIPVFFWLILRYYRNNFKLFFSFGFLSLLFAFANANPPLMVIYQISIVTSVIIASCYLEKRLIIRKIIVKYLVVLFSFLLFNFWWILNWFYILSEAQEMYTSGTALSWLFGEQGTAILHKIFLLKWLIPAESDYNYLSLFYNQSFIQPLLAIPVLLIVFSFFQKRGKEKGFLVTFLFLLITGFLMKGTRPPLGGAYVLLIKYLPFFSIFKTSAEKWGIFFIFLLSLLLIFGFKNYKKTRFSSLAYTIFITYLLLCSYPLVTSNFITDYKIKDLGWGSRKYQEKDEHRWLRESLNADKEEYRILSLPGSFNYQVAMHLYADKYYTGLDPLVSNIKKPFITAYGNNALVNFDVLFNNISSPSYKKLLSLFNVRKILLNKDIYPWFGFSHRETMDELEARFDKDFPSEKKESVILYDNDQFLPRFYIPDYQIYVFNGKISDLAEVIELEDHSAKTVVFFREELETDLARQVNKFIIPAKADRITEEELIRSTEEPEAVLFPYVKWDPDFLFYPLVLKKEQWTERRLKDDPPALFEKKLFYAAKRISEIERFFSGDELEKLDRQMKAYRQKMKEAMEIGNESKDKNQLLRVRFHLEVHRDRIKKLKFSPEVMNQIEIVFNELEAELDKLETKRDYVQLVYSFNTPFAGEYEILSKIDSDAIESIEVDKEKIIPQPIEKEDWYSFRKHFFSPGGHGLVLSLKELPNLVNSQDWDEFNVIENKDGELVFLNQNIIPVNLLEDCGSGDCAFFPNKESLVVFQEIKDYQPNSIYRIEFDYSSEDAVFGLAIIQDKSRNEITGKVNPSLMRILPLTGKEQRHSDFLYKSSHNASSAKLLFFSRVKDKRVGEAGVENVKVQRIYEPEIFLKRTDSQGFSKMPQLPRIIFSKVNSTKYRVRIKGAKEPYTLVFNENFHRGWRAYFKEASSSDEEIVASYFDGQVKQTTSGDIFLDGNTFETWAKEPVSEEKHYLVNGYANAWYIAPEDVGGTEDYEIIIEYWPQRLFYLGIGVTLVTLLGCLGYLSFSLVRSRAT